jgi:nucleolar protein 6
VVSIIIGNTDHKSNLPTDPPPTIRLLTSKRKNLDGSSKSGSSTEKSKGCAFLEFSKASGLQTALRLHHSELDGRKINVELSAGGGGKSDGRMKKLQEKNSKLDVSLFKSVEMCHLADSI